MGNYMESVNHHIDKIQLLSNSKFNLVIYWLCDLLASDLTSLSLLVSLSLNGI